MEKKEKAKVIIDYDKYQDLLKRVNDADKNTFAVANNAYYKAKQEDAALVDILREKIASLEKDNSDLCSALSNLKGSYESLKHDCVDIMNGCRKEGYIDFTSIYTSVRDKK